MIGFCQVRDGTLSAAIFEPTRLSISAFYIYESRGRQNHDSTAAIALAGTSRICNALDKDGQHLPVCRTEEIHDEGRQ
jgi:hypothetical protein